MGSWKSIDELEENISLQELHRLYLTVQRTSYNDKMFRAALEGVKMEPYEDPDYADVTTFEELKQRVAAKQHEASGGMVSSYPEYEEMGFSVEEY